MTEFKNLTPEQQQAVDRQININLKELMHPSVPSSESVNPRPDYYRSPEHQEAYRKQARNDFANDPEAITRLVEQMRNDPNHRPEGGVRIDPGTNVAPSSCPPGASGERIKQK